MFSMAEFMGRVLEPCTGAGIVYVILASSCGNVSLARGLSLFSLEMCTGFERFFGNVSLVWAPSMFSSAEFMGRVLETCTGAGIVSVTLASSYGVSEMSVLPKD